MKGKITLEFNGPGIAVSTQLEDVDILAKLELMHAAAIGLHMDDTEIKMYCMAETLGIFKDAETMLGCESDAQMQQLLRGEQPAGTVINLTELRRQARES